MAKGPIILAGDLNIVLSNDIDRHGAAARGGSPLEACVRPYNLVEAWRWKNPDTKAYSCYSFTFNTLSRLDMYFVSGEMLLRVVGVQYLPRAILDHSPLLLTIDMERPRGYVLWQLSPLWPREECFERSTATSIYSYWLEHRGEVPIGVTWDAFKATLRGSIAGVIKQLQSDREWKVRDSEQTVTEAKVEYIKNPNPETYRTWMEGVYQLDLVIVEKTQKKLLYQTQRIFEFGDKNSRLLAYLAHSQKAPASIADTQKRLCTLQPDIADAFIAFYSDLYSSRVNYGEEAVWDYLVPIPLLELSGEAAKELSIMVDEIRTAVCSLNPNKTPGLDGLPVEFYSTYNESLATKLLEIYRDAFDKGMLPESLREALIVLIPKPHKDHDYCESYRPISLINMDAKILVKILAQRLNKVIASIIHLDQTGFIPARSTAINLRCLFTVLQSEGPNPDTRVVVSLDTHKAFNYIEWPYLLAVLKRLRFRPKFIAWVHLLYAKPLTRLIVNKIITDTFEINRGTPQGCPLSPLLFALAIEPLAALLRVDRDVRGCKINALEEKTLLYADDMLLYFSEAEGSLDRISKFGEYSGFKVNWNKSIIFPFSSEYAPRLPPEVPLQMVSRFRYLGV